MQPSIFNREPRPYVMVRLACSHCGPVRMALVPQVITTLECPYCFKDMPAEQIGTGQTLRALPYFESEADVYAYMRDSYRSPHDNPRFLRLVRGQLVVYCEEESVLHLACIGDVFTNQVNLSPIGIPSISFKFGDNEIGPIPHVSMGIECPPWWCLPDEIRMMNTLGKIIPSKKIISIPPDKNRRRPAIASSRIRAH